MHEKTSWFNIKHLKKYNDPQALRKAFENEREQDVVPRRSSIV